MSSLRVRPTAAAVLACGLLTAGTGLTGLIVVSQAGREALRPGRPTPIPAPAGRIAALAQASIPGRAANPARANSPARAAAGSAVARPVGLVIPAIGLRTRLIRLGTTRSGVLQVPSTTAVAGWYTGGPRPGAIGPAVIAGHIDSYRGPGVFFRLRQLHPRDRVYVRRSDGTLAVFRVTSVHTYPKDHFPTAAVYGPVPGAQLRLITCGGTFDPALRSYLSNVVVYAAAAARPHHARPHHARPHRARPHRARPHRGRQLATPPAPACHNAPLAGAPRGGT